MSVRNYQLLIIALCLLLLTAACENDKNDEVEETMVVTIVDAPHAAGVYRVCWEQVDDENEAVSDGEYRVMIEVGDHETAIDFEISPIASSVSPPDCNASFGGLLPRSYKLEINAGIYAIGDTVAITYDLPAAVDVLIRIESLPAPTKVGPKTAWF